MEGLSKRLQDNVKTMKKLLPAEDVLVFPFSSTESEAAFALVYADGIVNKELLGDLVVRPLLKEKSNAPVLQEIKRLLLFPECKVETHPKALAREVLDGNALLLCEGERAGLIVGVKAPPTRAVVEPPTSVAVKGPREGFVEDIKINAGLIRKRLKDPSLRLETMKVGRRTDTNVALCYLDGIANKKVVAEVKKRLEKIDTDVIIDSSYIACFIAPRAHSIFPQTGTTEKPDILTAKIAEGRVGILVDGSPVALTVPFLLAEDFQAPDDYFTSPFSATVIRALRAIAVLTALLLPALYVASQLFKLQLLPLGLTLTVASSIQGIPLSPSLEMFLVLFVLEVIKEASIRMPKYVSMALSVVGALVLGETAVSAGFVSTPAIIIVAFSGLCLYTVPDFTETGTLLRWLFLIAAGCFGAFGVVVTAAFLLAYLVSTDAFGAPLLSPFAPLIPLDVKDSVVKYSLTSLRLRPTVFRLKNRTRLVRKGEKR